VLREWSAGSKQKIGGITEMKKTIVAPGLLAAKVSDLGSAIARVEQAGAQYLHIDVMDGHFAPNFSFGPNIVEGLRGMSKMFFDVHLIIDNPELFTPMFIKAGADCITVHAEAKGDIEEVRKICRESGKGFGVSVNPNTPVEDFEHLYSDCDLLLIMSIEPGYGGQKFFPASLDKIAKAKEIRERLGASYLISVDGGVTLENAVQCVAAGADVLVAGGAVFNAEDPDAVITEIMNM